MACNTFCLAWSWVLAVVVLRTLPVGSMCFTIPHTKQVSDGLLELGAKIAEVPIKIIRHTSCWCCVLSGLLLVVGCVVPCC